MPELKEDITTKELVKHIIDAAQDLKATNITEINLDGIESAPTTEFVICAGRSTSHVSSIADNSHYELSKQLKRKPYTSDGYRNSQWIILDYGNVMVHVFLPDTREFYNIEDLWSDAEITQIPDLD